MGKFTLGGTDLNKLYVGTNEVQTEFVPYVFIEATGGDITYDGDYKIHTFTSSGEFEIVHNGAPLNTLELLAVAGGGDGQHGGNIAGIGGYSGAGGGAGGVVYIQEEEGYNLPSGSYTITVGTGSAANTGEIGQNSVISGSSITLTALGGGGVDAFSGNNGGSGAGTRGGVLVTGGCGTPSPAANIGLQPTASGDSGTYGFGNDGGLATNCQQSGGVPAYTHYMTGGGGGGAGGGAVTSTGGAGKTIDITGTNVTYAKGGDANSGVATTGYGDGGAGGAVNTANAKGGNAGIVIFRYRYQ